mmetsp:Transcript_19622/g.55198  ORF Transcript_19622/g.55198 Transcript_19622/m.55198 type:complete len:245 (-) Transcript_19622:112-846(-)
MLAPRAWYGLKPMPGKRLPWPQATPPWPQPAAAMAAAGWGQGGVAWGQGSLFPGMGFSPYHALGANMAAATAGAYQGAFNPHQPQSVFPAGMQAMPPGLLPAQMLQGAFSAMGGMQAQMPGLPGVGAMPPGQLEMMQLWQQWMQQMAMTMQHGVGLPPGLSPEDMALHAQTQALEAAKLAQVRALQAAQEQGQQLEAHAAALVPPLGGDTAMAGAASPGKPKRRNSQKPGAGTGSAGCPEQGAR